MAQSAQVGMKGGRSRVSFLGDSRTKSIVAGVVLGVLQPALQQIAERLDTFLFGGVLPPFGAIVGNSIGFIGAAGFGFIPGVIAAEINPFMSLATGTSPLAIFFFGTNIAVVLGVRLMMVWRGKRAQEFTWVDALYMSVFGQILATLVLIPVQLYVLNLPPMTVLVLNLIGLVPGGVVPALIVPPILRALDRANLIGERA